MTLPLTKTLHPDDYAALRGELEVVDLHFMTMREQHPARRWEYAMALHAWTKWRQPVVNSLDLLYDVGGAGSPFRYMLMEDLEHEVIVVDPEEPEPNDWGLEEFIGANPRLADAVFCLSVLEHVEDLDQFLYHLSCLVAPGGLLFLTMDACGCPSHAADMEVGEPPDQHHFHWMRKRIFGAADRRWVAERMLSWPFQVFGQADVFTYHGDHVYDYSFASLALVKRA